MIVSPPLARRRPLSNKIISSLYPDSPESIPSSPARIQLGTPYRTSLEGRIFDKVLEDTPSPLRELEQGWKEVRRKRLSDQNVVEKGYEQGIELNKQYTSNGKNNVRFVTSSTSALLTPPNTPPQSPKIPLKQVETVQGRSAPLYGHIETSDISSAQPINPVTIPKTTSDTHAPNQTTFKPITSFPLPPTPYPVALLAGKKDTIYIPPPTSRYELILNLVGGRRIHVKHGGNVIEFISEKGKEKERILQLEESELWNKEDKRDWENLRGVAEGFKRITPRVKLFHPLGHLSVTCSSPPDIILSFRIASHSPSISLDDTSSPGNESRTNNQSKIRLVYSRATQLLKIDTTSTYIIRRKKEKFRTKRIVPILRTDLDQGRSNDRSLRLKEISILLGVNSDTSGWREEEQEGLRRLWVLRKEWGRWEGG